ncbi:DUF3857 domain-containing protein [Marinihelvus fidelis]|nr:DUF3857 domain-containing protein [Marinihelvus fidelis]
MKGWLAGLTLFAWAGIQAGVVHAQESEVAFGPEPGWVVDVPPPMEARAAEDELSGGMHYLLVDWQTQETANERESWSHYAVKVLDRAGLENASSFTVEFDPRYQAATIHTARLLRDGQVIDQADQGRVSVFQRESDMERHLLDGRLTAQLIFDDVRVGDVVEWSYTVSGKNPALRGHIGLWRQLEWSQPVGRRHVRVRVPAGQSFNTQALVTDQQPVVVDEDGWQAFVWDADNLPGRMKPDDAPAWYQFYPAFELSSFNSWSELQQWGIDIYSPRTEVTPAIEAQAREIRAVAGDDPSALAMAALHFVQEEIRYLGFQMGESGYIPAEPDETLSRRYGDCKGKTALLISLLQALGLPSAPALAHTEEGKTLNRNLPSPLMFNHVIVLMDLGGQRYFLDPTLTDQATRLDAVVQPAYGWVLPLARGYGDGLLDTTDHHDGGMISILERVSQQGEFGADLVIETTYTGAEADRARGSMSTKSLRAVTDQYTDFMGKYYEGLVSTETVRFEDDRDRNELVAYESYSVSDFWLSEDRTPGSAADAALYGWQLRSTLTAVDTAPRTAPVAREYPARIQHVVELDLADGWALPEESNTVEDAQFSMTRAVSYVPGRFRVEYHYQALDDHVPADARDEHGRHIDDAWDLSAYHIERYAQGAGGGEEDTAGASPWFWVGSVVVAFATLLLAWLVRLLGVRHWLLELMFQPYRQYASLPVPYAAGMLVAMFVGMVSMTANLIETGLEGQLPMVGLLAVILLAGVLTGLLNIFIGGTAWALAARLVDGKGKILPTVWACAWGQLPNALFMPMTLLTVAVLGDALFNPDLLVADTYLLKPILMAGWGMGLIVSAVWSLINCISTVAVVQQISRGRSFGAMLISVCGMLAIVFSLVLLVLIFMLAMGLVDGL